MLKSKAQEALDKTKVHLMTKAGTTFFSYISMQLSHELDSNVKTACTNGTYVKYNPDFFLSLSKDERLGLVLHEVSHVAFMHMFRLKDRDRNTFNKAADHVINLLLLSKGFKLPPGVLHDARFTGMGTEEVYEILKQEGDTKPSSGSQDLVEPSTDPSGSIAEAEQKLTSILVSSMQRTQMSQGDIPAEITRRINELINPKLDWRSLLLRFVEEKVRENTTWSRPNKRYTPQYYLPSKSSETLGNITVAIDTSGSVSNDLLKSILTEIAYIKDIHPTATVTILDCDYMIHNIHQLEDSADILDLKFSGGGGTSALPVINYCKENETKLLIYFTDGYFEYPTEEQDYPILWVIYNNTATIPIGETIHINLKD